MNKRVPGLLSRWLLDLRYATVARQMALNPENARLICGDPRGGTTWMAELLSQIPGTSMLWEPLAINRNPEFRKLGFGWRQYIPETADWPDAKMQFLKLFSGKMLSSYLCQATTPAEIRESSHLLIKFCRASQLLPWLTYNFKFRYAPVYLIRHPCAVVASQLRQGGWSHVSPKFEIPRTDKFSEFYSDHKDFLNTINSVEKRLAAVWCLCNSIPLKYPKEEQRWITITYESLLTDPHASLHQIANRWNVQLPDAILQTIEQSSITTVSGSPILSGSTRKQLEYWKSSLSKKQISEVLEVVNYFGIDLYGSDVVPNY